MQLQQMTPLERPHGLQASFMQIARDEHMTSLSQPCRAYIVQEPRIAAFCSTTALDVHFCCSTSSMTCCRSCNLCFFILALNLCNYMYGRMQQSCSSKCAYCMCWCCRQPENSGPGRPIQLQRPQHLSCSRQGWVRLPSNCHTASAFLHCTAAPEAVQSVMISCICMGSHCLIK